MVVVEGQFLLPVGPVFGMVHVQDDDRGWAGIAGNEDLDKGLGQTIDVLAGESVLQPRERGAGGQIIVGIQRRPPDRELERGSWRRLLASLPSA